jgi:transcriptional regulator GlxA family with amidase domain
MGTDLTVANYTTKANDVALRLSLDWRICCAQALMRRKLDRKVKIQEVANVVGLSASRFSHLFKIQTGVSPVKYVKHLRLNRTKDLLEDPSLSVKEVAARVGLDASRLVEEFHRSFGITPLQYRRFRLDVPGQ